MTIISASKSKTIKTTNAPIRLYNFVAVNNIAVTENAVGIARNSALYKRYDGIEKRLKYCKLYSVVYFVRKICNEHYSQREDKHYPCRQIFMSVRFVKQKNEQKKHNIEIKSAVAV